MTDIIQKLKISPEKSALNALAILDSSNRTQRLVLVVDESDQLIGTVNDSDIRRGLLRGLKIEMPICQFMNRNYLSIKEGETCESIFKIAKANNISVIPILNDEGKILNIYSAPEDNFYLKNDHPVLIMAGGRGTRLHPYTYNCPKPMIKVGGKPMLELIIKQYIESGFSNFYISVNYLKEQIISYFGDGKEFNISINYLEEDRPLGTAGSIGLIQDSIDKDLIITNADILTHFNPDKLLHYHTNQNASATIGARYIQTKLEYGVIEVSNMKLQALREKPVLNHLVNAGVYIVQPQVVNLIQQNEYLDMPDLLLRAKNSGLQVYVCPIHEEWIDVGRPESLKQAEELLR